MQAAQFDAELREKEEGQPITLQDGFASIITNTIIIITIFMIIMICSSTTTTTITITITITITVTMLITIDYDCLYQQYYPAGADGRLAAAGDHRGLRLRQVPRVQRGAGHRARPLHNHSARWGYLSLSLSIYIYIYIYIVLLIMIMYYTCVYS